MKHFQYLLKILTENFAISSVIIICSILAVFFTADALNKPKEDLPIYVTKISHEVTTATSSSSSTSVSTSSKASSSSTTQTTAITTTYESISTTEITTEITTESPTEYQPPVYNYLSTEESPNSSFYQDRLVIVGDSIAYGFNAYGYIPYEHNIAAESLAVWNMDSYSFDVGGGPMGLFDAVSYTYSPLYYVSIGMNDIYTYYPDDYAWSIRNIAEEILARVPTATVVIGGITPVSDGNYYTDNDTIREFNYSLEYVINDMQSSQVLFFNTHDVLCDQNTMALGVDYAGGDGLHLNSSAYAQILHCLFNFLDSSYAIEQIQAHENSN